MKSHTLSHTIISILILSVLGCTKEEIVKKTPFFHGDCRVERFYPFGQRNYHYFAHYGAEGHITGVSFVKDPNAELMYQFEFNNQRLVNITKHIIGKDYQAFKYEYGINGIELIRRYEPDLTYYNLEHSPSNFEYNREVNQSKYIYGKAGKPSSMVLSSTRKDTLTNTVTMTPIFSYDYEYDERGNLVKEICYQPDNDKKMQVWSTLYHYYDNKPNTLKPLHYLFYNVSYSAPYMFSENNKIGTKEVRNYGYETEKNYPVEYDSNGNVTKDGLLFSDIKWQCP